MRRAAAADVAPSFIRRDPVLSSSDVGGQWKDEYGFVSDDEPLTFIPAFLDYYLKKKFSSLFVTISDRRVGRVRP